MELRQKLETLRGLRSRFESARSDLERQSIREAIEAILEELDEADGGAPEGRSRSGGGRARPEGGSYEHRMMEPRP